MSEAYSIVDIPKSLPIHGMALTSTGRKIEHNKVVLGTQTYESISSWANHGLFAQFMAQTRAFNSSRAINLLRGAGTRMATFFYAMTPTCSGSYCSPAKVL